MPDDPRAPLHDRRRVLRGTVSITALTAVFARRRTLRREARGTLAVLVPERAAKPGLPLTGMGDMNGDGRPDLYAREASTGKLWLYPGRASALGARVLAGNDGWNGTAKLIAVGDFSGDGRPDLWPPSPTAGTRSPDYSQSPGWLFTYRGKGKGNGLLAGSEAADGEWQGLDGFC